MGKKRMKSLDRMADDDLDELIYTTLFEETGEGKGLWLGWILAALEIRGYDALAHSARVGRRVRKMAALGFVDSNGRGSGTRWFALRHGWALVGRMELRGAKPLAGSSRAR